MAKFLDTQAISSELMNLLKSAKEKIILVSPYLKVNTQIQERLKTRAAIGTLSEIVIVYGKTDLQESEVEWMKGILDLKLIEKENLHAKCFLNEDRAIISSMNLYDYSQQNNIEMGLLITRENDREAYEGLMEEINNIKINGVRKDILTLKSIGEKETENNVYKEDNPTGSLNQDEKINLSYFQQMKFELLKQWRLNKSRDLHVKAYTILTDREILSIISQQVHDKNSIFDSIPKKKALQYSLEILDVLFGIDRYTIGEVTGIFYQADESGYDRVRLKIIDSGKESWFDTTKELPLKGKHVAVSLYRNWFNDYFYLD